MKERNVLTISSHFVWPAINSMLFVDWVVIQNFILIKVLCTSRHTSCHDALLRPDDHKAIDSEPSHTWQDSFDVLSTSTTVISKFLCHLPFKYFVYKTEKFFSPFVKIKNVSSIYFPSYPNDSCLFLYISALFSGNLQALNNHQNA